MKLQTVKLRKILLLLLSGGMSFRAIANMTGVSHQTVMRVKDKLKDISLDLTALNSIDDLELSSRFTVKRSIKAAKLFNIDWHKIDIEHRQKKIPLIVLWTEIAQSINSTSEDFISEHQFRRQYKKWRRSQHISMRQFHRPGEKVFVDFCGKTIPIYDSAPGNISHAQIFVGVLGGSGLIFAYAVQSQKSVDWLRCHVKMFEYFEGVPEFLVPDNLKSAVTKHTSHEIILNRAYQELADHFNTKVMPARVRKPKDKSLSEIGVRIIQSWALSSFRNIKFFSIDELNTALLAKLNQINQRVTKTYPESRWERFHNSEKATLRGLPTSEFCLAEWIYNKRVGVDYHIQYSGNSYSVPFGYINQLVDIKISQNTIEIFNGAKRVAVHSLDPLVSGTNPNHMPAQHRSFYESVNTDILQWALEVGQATHQWCKHQFEHNKNFANGRKACERLHRLVRNEQNKDDVELACSFAAKVNNYSFSYLKEVLAKQLHLRRPPEKTAWITTHENIRGAANYADIGNKV